MPLPSPDPHAMPAHRRFYEAIVERQSEETVRTRVLGGFYVFGGILALASLLLPTAPELIEPGILAIGSFACAGGVVMLALPQLIPPNLLTGVLAMGNLLITSGVYFSQSTTSVYALLYVWVGFQAAYFFPRGHAVAHVLGTAFTYSVALALVPGSDRG